jgi:uncharacterized membrane protein
MMVGVCLYHFGFDLTMFFGVSMPWFWGWQVQGARDCVTGTLLFVSGISCSLSHSNIKRGLRTFAIAMALSAGSLLVAPTQGIWFGVLHCYGVCMLLWGLLGDVERRVDARIGGPLLLFLFAVLRFIASGMVWLPFLWTISLPDALYQNKYLFWLGFPRSDFVSADYWPLLPWGLLFVAGGLLGQHWHRYGFPDWLRNRAFAPLAAFGRHTLSVYLIHQPVFIGLLWLWFHFSPIVQSYLR